MDEFFYYLENIEKFQVFLLYAVISIYSISYKKKTSFRLSSIQNHYDFADLSFFSNDEKKEYMPIYELLIAFSKHPNHLEELIENEKKRKNASLDEAFSIFLIKISQNLKPQFFQEITFLLCVYRNVLFQEKTKYEQFDTNFFLEKSEFDYLLINTFREMLEKRKLYLGEELIDVMQLKDFVKHLRNWLNRCHFTEIGD